jgi:serine/threonine protein kinase
MNFENIDEEIALKILGLSDLPSRSMCSKLESIYSDKSCPNGIYVVTNNRIGEQSAFGKIYEACCHKTCDYVAKWQPDIEVALKEAEIQHIVSQENLSSTIHNVWICDSGVIIIMDSLISTALNDLKEITDEQEANTEVIRPNVLRELFKKALAEIGKPEWFEKITLKTLNQFKKYREIINKAIHKNNLDIQEIPEISYSTTIPDNDQQIKHKTTILNEVVSLLKRIHTMGYYHGDTHLNNFMRDREGNYKMIDFGMSGLIRTDDNVDKDFLKVEASLIALGIKHPHLEYLIEVYVNLI